MRQERGAPGALSLPVEPGDSAARHEFVADATNNKFAWDALTLIAFPATFVQVEKCRLPCRFTLKRKARVRKPCHHCGKRR